jgi:hypothetical protein
MIASNWENTRALGDRTSFLRPSAVISRATVPFFETHVKILVKGWVTFLQNIPRIKPDLYV